MKDFFSYKPGIFHFELFGSIHIFISLLTILIIYLIYINKEKLKLIKYQNIIFRYGIAILMFLNMAIYYGHKIVNNTYNYKVHLPLHLCFFGGYLFMYTLVTNNKKLFKSVYFLSFIGPLPAIIFPDLTVGFDRFQFWQFVISHHVFLIASLYCLYVLEWKVNKKDIKNSFILANAYLIAIIIFNNIFDTNYLMVKNLPKHILEFFPILKILDFPLFWTYSAAIIALYIAYYLTSINYKKQLVKINKK